jgi:two-component system, OmpR family, sensor kinase
MRLELDLKEAYENVISVFYDIAKDMTSTFDEKEIIGIALNLMKKVIDYESVSFLKYSAPKEMYLIERAINYNDSTKKILKKIIKDGLIEWAARSGKPFVTLEEDSIIKTSVIVPLMSKEELIGAIVIHTKKDDSYFDINRIKILGIISNQLTISFENLGLYKDLERRSEKLKALKNYMDNVVKSLTNGIIVVDRKDRVRVFNRKMQELLNINYIDILGKEFGKCKFNRAFINFIKYLHDRTYKGEKIIDEEFEYKLSDDIMMPLGVSTTLLVNEGVVNGIIFVIRDRRESKELEQLKRVDKLKDEFLSMVSHELRTPLTSIKAYTETLMFMVGEGDTESEMEFLKIITEESERLTRLINDVLDLSKIEAGKMNFFMEEENIVEIVKKSIKNMKGFAESKSITINEIIENENIKVYIDKDRTMQVLANLINNAVKFTPEKGLIEVGVALRDNKFAVVTIKDNGIGIKSEEHSNIFEKFKQSEDVMVRTVGGTGLGLSISKNIVEHFGGKIWVESEYGKGATFLFTIPLIEISDIS